MEPCKIDQYTLKPGTSIGISVRSLHHHPDFWDKALEFIPERFSPENIKKTLKHPFQYIPFSSGPRSCIGQRFAQTEAILLFAHLLARFTISITPEDAAAIYFEEKVTCGPKNFFLNLIER